MKIPRHLIPDHLTFEFFDSDGDTTYFFHRFDEPEAPLKILEVGAHDEPVANILAAAGHDVYGIDLRQYDPESPPCNYTYTRGDFCDPPESFYQHLGTFDSIISISAIEHFGLNTYQEGNYNPYYDVIALHMVRLFLKQGGTAYITVPCAGNFLENRPHWRVYDVNSVNARLVQGLEVVECCLFVTAPLQIDDRIFPPFSFITAEEIKGLTEYHPPHLSLFLKLCKTAPPKLAPDGR